MGRTKTKPTGRPKGSKNKINSENRELIQAIVNEALQGVIQKDIALLTPKERVDAVAKLHAMTSPKVTEALVDVKVEETEHPHLFNLASKQWYIDNGFLEEDSDEEE